MGAQQSLQRNDKIEYTNTKTSPNRKDRVRYEAS